MRHRMTAFCTPYKYSYLITYLLAYTHTVVSAGCCNHANKQVNAKVYLLYTDVYYSTV